MAEVGIRPGLGDGYLRVGYLKAFMDGTLGSQTARMLDGSGVEITSGDELAEIVRRGAEAGWPVAVHAIGDLANREALDAFERTKEHWQPLGLGSGSSTRSASPSTICPASPSSASPPPFSSATHRRIATLPSASGPTSWKERTRSVR